MKNLIVSAVLLFSASVLAESLPAIENPRVEVTMPSRFTPVQPYANLVFEYSSCAKRTFSVKEHAGLSSGSVTAVKVVEAMDVDCMGPTTKRTYRLQVSSDFRANDQVIVLNPVPTQLKR